MKFSKERIETGRMDEYKKQGKQQIDKYIGI